MARRTVDDAAAAMGGRVIAGDGAAAWHGAVFDSRKVAGGELFFALPGEHTDGHRFVARALAAGAAAAVVHQDIVLPGEDEAGQAASGGAAGTLIRVPDTYAALHELTRAVRREVPQHLVAITGSAGKTTTKELLTAMLDRRWRTAKNQGNLNNLYGFPLSLLGIPADTEWMVAEMGMSSAGELSQLSRLARPDAVVFTNVRPVHLEFFASVHDIAEAKAELLEGLVPGGLVVANADDPEVSRFVRRYAAAHPDATAPRVIWYGRGDAVRDQVEVTAVELESAAGTGGVGTRFILILRGGALGADRTGQAGAEQRRRVSLPLHGRFNVDNALAAAACAAALGVPIDEVAAALGEVRHTAGRGEIHQLPMGALLIDDSYNSNPEALELALADAAMLAAGRRHWAVLGDMLELGPEGPGFHRRCGERAAAEGFSPVAGVGELAAELVAGAAVAGAATRWFADSEAAAEWAASEVRDDDLVLIKGSRGVRLDRVVAALRGGATGAASSGVGGRARDAEGYG